MNQHNIPFNSSMSSFMSAASQPSVQDSEYAQNTQYNPEQ